MSEEAIIGRGRELEILRETLESSQAEFIALYGRRRVGKTFLISEFFRDKGLYFELTGIKGANKALQLKNFVIEYADCFQKQLKGQAPKDWVDAFNLLRHELERSQASRIILFFDELPWLASHRSGFLSALDYLWNRYLSRDSRIILIVCGSAASWIIKKVINNRAGLYGRLTRQIRLLPYTLYETEQYLLSRGIELDRKQVAELYMALGGVPKYLSEVPPGQSAAQIIQKVFFDVRGFLSSEFWRLYESLFDRAHKHVAVVKLLARHRLGLSKNDIINALPEISSGGGFTDLLNELEESGFILFIPQFGRKKKDGRYLLADEYSLFFLTWVEPLMGPGIRPVSAQYWLRQHESPSYRSWAGYSFESLCLKHVDKIIQVLGLIVVATAYSGWRFIPKKGKRGEEGAQIDLVIGRTDRCINLCEIKFSGNEYVVTKEYAAKLQSKKNIFRNITKTKATLFTTLITSCKAKRNSHFLSSVDNQLTLDDLFS